MENKNSIIDKLIWFTLLTSVILVPLFFTTANTELFEVPKMFIVYLSAVLLLTLTSLKFILSGKLEIPKSLVFYSLAAFVAIQVASTFTSIDKFTSVFGYPTRLNGGLLSSFAYLIIFTSALINLNFQKAQKLLLAMIASAFAVALWGIPRHFGAEPNCLILTRRLNATCWQKEFDPTVRIFSTLGQPNWLASFIVLVLPFAAALLIATKKGSRLLPFVICAALGLALIFTGSVSGILGFLASVMAFSVLIGTRMLKKNIKILGIITALLFMVLVFAAPTIKNRISQSLSQKTAANAGTPSGQIRLVVWQGALSAFGAKPILGFGPETFIYSYYQFRPQAHNQTTEWNFYYNKAHNEFLNYAANTGILGLGSYLAFIILSVWQLFKIARSKNAASIWAKAAIASITGYLVTIFFGFSIVATQLFMFLAIAAVLVLSGTPAKVVDLKISGLAKKALSLTTAVLGLWLLIFIFRLYFADLLINRAKSTVRLTSYLSAVSVSPIDNPFYLADYAYTLAIYSGAQKDPTLAKILIDQSMAIGQKALNISPLNLLVLNKVASAAGELSTADTTYKIKVLELNKKAILLAPTDPTSYLNLAKSQRAIGQIKEAQKSAETALQLKPDYQEAKGLLDQIQDKKLQ